MAYTSADLANVDKTIIDLATGKRETRFVIDGEVVEYHPVDLPQLRALRSDIISEIAGAATNGSAVSAFIVSGGKGL